MNLINYYDISARLPVANRQNTPAQNTVVIPVQCAATTDNYPPPPPYTAEPCSNFEQSLPSYAQATGRSS